MAEEHDPTCINCGRTNHTGGYVCEPCRENAANQLAELAQHAPLLPLALIPGSGGRSDGVRAPKSDGAPLPLRLDAFSLLAAGTFDPDLREADSQIGMVPLRVWLEDWYADWARRYLFGPTGPARVNIPAVKHSAAADGSAALMRSLLTSDKIVTGHVDIEREIPDARRKAPYGAKKQITVSLAVTRSIADTVDAEHAARFGRPPAVALNDLIAALASRLDAACDESEDVVDFLTGLRIMLGACRAVLGERSDLTFIGRCPQERRLREEATAESCGGAIWQDPYVTMIRCPRCKHVWPEREWLTLGGRIRALQQIDVVIHEFEAGLVVAVDIDPIRGSVPTDRYWSTRCGCGRWQERVHGTKIDARGRWRRHVIESGKPLDVRAAEIAVAIIDRARLRGHEPGSIITDQVAEVYDQFRHLDGAERVLLVQAVAAAIGTRS